MPPGFTIPILPKTNIKKIFFFAIFKVEHEIKDRQTDAV